MKWLLLVKSKPGVMVEMEGPERIFRPLFKSFSPNRLNCQEF